MPSTGWAGRRNQRGLCRPSANARSHRGRSGWAHLAAFGGRSDAGRVDALGAPRRSIGAVQYYSNSRLRSRSPGTPQSRSSAGAVSIPVYSPSTARPLAGGHYPRRGSNGVNKTGQIPERCASIAATISWWGRTACVDGVGQYAADLRLQRDDVIYVPSASERFVSVLGEVQHPAPFR